MRRETRQSDAPTPCSTDPRAAVLPAVALFGGGPTWLEGTLAALVGVILLGAAAWMFVSLGNRFHWWSSAEAIQLKRTVRVTFGALFLASLTLPYLIVRLPMVAIALLTLGMLAAVPYACAPVDVTSRRERTTGEHGEVE